MANVTIGGFRAVGTLSGGPIPTSIVRPVANNYATQLNVGDAIVPVSDGTVAAAAANSTILLGVIDGCSFVPTQYPAANKRILAPFIPASLTFSPSTVGSPNESLVSFVPCTGDVIFEVDANGTTVNTVAGRVGLIGENCNLVITGTPSTAVGNSCMFLDDSSHATSAAQWRIIGIPGYTLENGLDITQAGMGDPTLSHCKFLVVCNQGWLPPYTTSGT
jgi:hypothetical protein